MERADDLAQTRRQVHQFLGGMEKVRALRLSGRRTARDFIDQFFDRDSFVELGTFAGMPGGASPTAAGDGRVTGHASLDGVPVGVIVDDVTVKRASSSALNARKADRVVQMAKRSGMPVLFVGEAGGARLPDTMRAEVFAAQPVYPWLFDDDRPPIVAAIVGDSYGGSSFVAALSDIALMTRGSVLALTSPRVISMATGVEVTPEQLGGVDVLASRTDLIDIVADGPNELDAVLRRALQFFTRPVVEGGVRPDADITEIVPTDPSRPYDIHRVIDAIVDLDSFLELGAARGRSLVTGLGRIDGQVVGVVASQPYVEAGALSPAACIKAARLTKLCDRFDFPILALIDTPGFQIGVEVEHAGMLRTAMDLIRVNTGARCPVVSLILRKAYGLAFFALFSPDHGGDVVMAWPDAHIGFMAPAVAANVLYSDEVAGLLPDQRRRRLAERSAALDASSDALDVAAAMGIDEIIDKSDTVSSIRRYLQVLTTRRPNKRLEG